MFCGRTTGPNAVAICCASLIEPVCLCACSWRVTRLCVLCVMVWHVHYGWVLTAGGMATDRGLVLVVLTLAGHNNLLLVKQVSSWQNHYCLHMVMRAGEGLGNRFRGGWSWAMACLGRGCKGGGVGEWGITFVLLHHWALESCLKLPQYKLAGLNNRSDRRGAKTDDKPEDLSQTYKSIL